MQQGKDFLLEALMYNKTSKGLLQTSRLDLNGMATPQVDLIYITSGVDFSPARGVCSFQGLTLLLWGVDFDFC